MEGTLIDILPNLGVGVASIGALVYIVVQFLNQLKSMRDSHELAMDKRESCFRALEREVRTEILSQLGKNTIVMERVMNKLDHT